TGNVSESEIVSPGIQISEKSDTSENVRKILHLKDWGQRKIILRRPPGFNFSSIGYNRNNSIILTTITDNSDRRDRSEAHPN
ncbi:19581_t:CDS:2, partial [Gigaspora margarita]